MEAIYNPDLPFINNLLGLSFVLWFFAAFRLFRSPRSSKMLGFGFALFGLNNFAWFLVRADVVYGGDYSEISPFIFGLASLLVVIAGIRLAGVARGSSGLLKSTTTQISTEVPMESLVIPRNATNSYTRADQYRDDLYDRIQEACEQAGIEAIGYKSQAHSGTIWLRFDYRLPQDSENLSLRSSLSITVERFDFHRFAHTFTLEVTHGTKSRIISGFISFEDRDIRALNRYLTTGRSFPKLRSRKVRQFPLQLWRPANKVAQLRPDYISALFGFGIVLGFFAVQAAPPVGLLLILGCVIGAVVYAWRRKTYILTTGKPLHDPRRLVRMDSWQTNIERLGPLDDELRTDLQERLKSTTEDGIQVTPEFIWYPGVDGKVERLQIVCAFRRAIGFVHVEPYGDDLYVGWDTHVNSGTWVEETLARGIDKKSGKFVVANRVVPGWQIPNEYDITDVNFLTEWLHGGIVRLVRLKLEEHKIDQEIDFTIQRESRKGALESTDPDEKKKKDSAGGLARRFTSRLRRVN